MRKLETEQEKIKEITEETTARVIKEIAKAEGILAAIGDGLTVLDRSFKVLYENQVVRDMMGDHVGEYCYMAYPKRQDICTGCPVALTFDDGKVHRVQRKGQAYKETRYFEITASPLKDSTGKIVAGIEVVRDITERKLTEEALRTSENKYRMLVEHSLQGILIACDSPLSFVFVNQALADIFGYTSDELMSLPPKEINSLLHPEDSSIFSQRFRDRLKGKQVPPRYEGRIIRKDGAVRWVEVYNTRIEYKGKPAVQSAFIDITDRKQTEEKLQRSEERFRALTENTSDWIWEVDQSLVFTYTSPRVKDLLGYEPNEVIGKTPFDFMQEHEAKRVSEICRSILASHKPFTLLENINLHKDGRQVIVETSGVPIFDKNGNFSGYRGIDRDITERKRVEEALQDSEKATRTLLNIPMASAFLIDRNGICLGANETFAKRLGKKVSDIVGKSMWEFFPSDVNAKRKALFEGVLASKQQFRYEDERQGMWHDAVISPILDEQGEVAKVVVFGLDITERKRAEKALREINETLEQRVAERTVVLNGINRIFRAALTSMTEEELGRACLAIVEEVTQSRFGFIGEIGPDGLLHDIAISDPGWELCTMYDKKTGHRRPPGNFKLHGLYGRVLTDGKAFYTNEPSSHPDSIGTPEGHPPLKAFLGAPLLHGGQTIGMIALGNREGGYRQEDLEMLEAITPTFVEALLRFRAEEKLRERERDLEIQTKNLEEINTALNVLLKKRDEDKTELEEKVLQNVQQLIEPYIAKLKLSGLDERQKALASILESNLKDMTSSFAYSLSSKHLNLTPKEIKVANLIKQGMTSKEICDILGSSEKVVAFHRQNIRRKLGLLNKKVNLKSYLAAKV